MLKIQNSKAIIEYFMSINIPEGKLNINNTQRKPLIKFSEFNLLKNKTKLKHDAFPWTEFPQFGGKKPKINKSRKGKFRK